MGKGTVVGRLMAKLPDLRLSRSWTTRAPRPGESPDAYVFVDRDAFLAKVEAGGFLEWTEFAGTGHLYGTPVPDPGAAGDLLLEIELDGARQVKRSFPDSVMAFIVAPSREEQEQRLRGRGDDDDSVRRRLEVGDLETAEGAALADHVVVNDDVERAATELADIIQRRRTAL